MCDWLNKFYAFKLLYMTLVNKMDGHGLSNAARHKPHQKRLK